jgi:heme/copper-type cytochrome/quinol oxidase subunit 1
MWFSVGAEMFQCGQSRLKVPAGTPRPAANYPGAFSDWNFISSIGAYVCAAS